VVVGIGGRTVVDVVVGRAVDPPLEHAATSDSATAANARLVLSALTDAIRPYTR
jgi:hypothetical protein